MKKVIMAQKENSTVLENHTMKKIIEDDDEYGKGQKQMTEQEFINLITTCGYSKDNFYDDNEDSILYVNDEHENILVKIYIQEMLFDILLCFPYTEEDSIESHFSSVRSEAFFNRLRKKCGERAKAQPSSFYCIFNDEVGLFGCKYNGYDLTDFIDCYKEYLKEAGKIDYEKILLQLIKENLTAGENYKIGKIPCFLTNLNGTHAIAKYERVVEWLANKSEKLENVTALFNGYEHIYFRSENFQSAISISSYNKIKKVSDELLHYYDENQKIEITKSGLVIISNDHFSSIHAGFRGVLDLITEEFIKMKSRVLQFREFSGINIWEEIAKEYSSEMNFNKLSADEFEALCADILKIRGYQDIKQIGKTNASDGGKDFIATDSYTNLLGTIELRKWLIQCKRAKKTLCRSDIQDIEQLLKENKAERYALFCSNSISPEAINRLLFQQDKNLSIRILWYSKPELERLIKSTYPQLILKYRLME